MRGEAPSRQQLAFQRREETLGHGVVVGVADGSHRGPHSGFAAAISEGNGRVLRSLVAMMNDVARPPLANRHLERVEHKVGPEMIGHRPADDLAAPGVEHDGKVEESARGRHEGDIGHPELVRRACLEVAIDQVRRRPALLVSAGSSPGRCRDDRPRQGRRGASAVRSACGHDAGRPPSARRARAERRRSHASSRTPS